MEQPFGNKPASNAVLVGVSLGVLAICVGMFWILATIKVELKVADRKISYRFPPFVNRLREYSLDELESWQIAKKSFMKTGIGLRFDPVSHARIYSIGTRHLLVIKLKTGKSYWISTRQPENLEQAIQRNQSREDE